MAYFALSLSFKLTHRYRNASQLLRLDGINAQCRECGKSFPIAEASYAVNAIEDVDSVEFPDCRTKV